MCVSIFSVMIKKYYGFPLGVIVYYMAMQYLALDDKEHALTLFKSTLVCFHPKSIYIPFVNEYIEKLTTEIENEKIDIAEAIKNLL